MADMEKPSAPPVSAERLTTALVTVRARLNLAGLPAGALTSVPDSPRLGVMLADGLVELVEPGGD